MNKNWRKFLAGCSSLAIMAALPLTSLSVSAEASTTENDPKATFHVDTETAWVGDTIRLWVDVGNVPEAGWNVLEFEVGYDADKLEPIMQSVDGEDEREYALGDALTGPVIKEEGDITDIVFESPLAIAMVSFKDYADETLNPIIGAVISSEEQKADGQLLNIAFKVKENVEAGDVLVLTPTVKTWSRSLTEVREDGKTYFAGLESLMDVPAAQRIEVTAEEPVPVPVLESIALDTDAVKTIYKMGEELDLIGLTVTAVYNDGSTEDIGIEDVTVTGFDSEAVGEKTVVISYEERSESFTVKVVKLGDVNLDGEVRAEDALRALQHATEKITLSGAALVAAEVDGVGEVTSNDALNILQYATEKITRFQVEK